MASRGATTCKCEVYAMSARTLIPRRKLFDNPTFFGAKLSPDGRLLSWLAPVDGVLNIWVSPVDSVAAGQPVTRTKGRPINWHEWSPDGRYLIFLNDENGDENLHLFAVDPGTCELRDLTPFANIRAMPTHWSHIRPDKIAISLNDRDPRWHDVFLLDLATGQRTLIWENRQGFDFVGLDWQLKPRHARSIPSDGARLWRFDDGNVTLWRDVGFDANWATHVMSFDATGAKLYMRSSIAQDKSALVRVAFATIVERRSRDRPNSHGK
jgi:dipeptidyl aminopeptidase/acylaminoacyl peptidase